MSKPTEEAVVTDEPSTDLVPSPRRVGLEELHARDRRAALERLQAEAETADAARAHTIMLQGRVIAEALTQAKAPLEEARLAGKASVVAARRLGSLLSGLPSKVRRSSSPNGGCLPSERGLVRRELGITANQMDRLVRLAAVADPEFQRYIQAGNDIPSLQGCLIASGGWKRSSSPGSRNTRRRRRVGVREPSNPSLDEGYSLIVRALGHLTARARGGSNERRVALGAAIQHLYDAEDLLKPYRGGYGS